jgi:hypothetical protein
MRICNRALCRFMTAIVLMEQIFKRDPIIFFHRDPFFFLEKSIRDCTTKIDPCFFMENFSITVRVAMLRWKTKGGFAGLAHPARPPEQSRNSPITK